MGAQNLSILTGTTLSATGGTAQNFTPDGVVIPSGLHLADAGQASFKLRNQISLKTKNPALVNGVYGKGKRWITLTVPMETAALEIVFNLVRIEIEVHAEMSAADFTDMTKRAAQLLFDSDLTSFLATGNLA